MAFLVGWEANASTMVIWFQIFARRWWKQERAEYFVHSSSSSGSDELCGWFQCFRPGGGGIERNGQEADLDEWYLWFAQQPLSAPHPTHLPMSGCDLNDEELANSLGAIAGLGRRRRVPTSLRLLYESTTDTPIANYACFMNAFPSTLPTTSHLHCSDGFISNDFSSIRQKIGHFNPHDRMGAGQQWSWPGRPPIDPTLTCKASKLVLQERIFNWASPQCNCECGFHDKFENISPTSEFLRGIISDE